MFHIKLFVVELFSNSYIETVGFTVFKEVVDESSKAGQKHKDLTIFCLYFLNYMEY